MKYTIFGESHGPAIGVTLTGVPAGLTLDWDAIQTDMARRAPGKSPLATARKEADQVQVLSGVFEGKTTGSPLCAMIANTDTRSADYSKTRDLARPVLLLVAVACIVYWWCLPDRNNRPVGEKVFPNWEKNILQLDKKQQPLTDSATHARVSLLADTVNDVPMQLFVLEVHCQELILQNMKV